MISRAVLPSRFTSMCVCFAIFLLSVQSERLEQAMFHPVFLDEVCNLMTTSKTAGATHTALVASRVEVISGRTTFKQGFSKSLIVPLIS